jgi:hypothetical protein
MNHGTGIQRYAISTLLGLIRFVFLYKIVSSMSTTRTDEVLRLAKFKELFCTFFSYLASFLKIQTICVLIRFIHLTFLNYYILCLANFLSRKFKMCQGKSITIKDFYLNIQHEIM